MRRSLALVLVALLAVTVTGCTKFGTSEALGNKTSTVVYKVSGSGTADVRYAATATARMTSRAGVKLPWQKAVTTTDHSQTVYSVGATGGTGTDCSITVNGVRVNATRTTSADTVTCSFIK